MLRPGHHHQRDRALAIQSGQSVAGTIRCRGESTSYFFDAPGGQRATITMDSTSGDLDPFLFLYGVGGHILAIDDDCGEDLNSRIEVSVPASGRYLLSANSVGDTGSYALTLTLGPEEPLLAIQSGQTVAGTIRCRGESTSYVTVHGPLLAAH